MSDDYKPYPDAGQLFATQSKKNPKSPDYFGEIAINLKDLTNVRDVDGLHVFKLSGWKKTARSGKTFLSISVSRMVPENKPAPQRAEPKHDDDDSDIPF